MTEAQKNEINKFKPNRKKKLIIKNKMIVIKVTQALN